MKRFLFLVPALLLAFAPMVHAARGGSCASCSAGQSYPSAGYVNVSQQSYTYIDPNPPGIQQGVYTTSYDSYAADDGSGNTAKRVRHFRLFGRRRCH